MASRFFFEVGIFSLFVFSIFKAAMHGIFGKFTPAIGPHSSDVAIADVGVVMDANVVDVVVDVVVGVSFVIHKTNAVPS